MLDIVHIGPPEAERVWLDDTSHFMHDATLAEILRYGAAP